MTENTQRCLCMPDDDGVQRHVDPDCPVHTAPPAQPAAGEGAQWTARERSGPDDYLIIAPDGVFDEGVSDELAALVINAQNGWTQTRADLKAARQQIADLRRELWGFKQRSPIWFSLNDYEQLRRERDDYKLRFASYYEMEARAQAAEAERDELKALFNAKCAACGKPTGENWYRCLQCESYFCKRCLEDHVKEGQWWSYRDQATAAEADAQRLRDELAALREEARRVATYAGQHTDVAGVTIAKRLKALLPADAPEAS